MWYARYMKPVVKKILYMIAILCVGMVGLVVTDQYDFIHKLGSIKLLANSGADLQTVQSELGQVQRGMPADSKIIHKK